MGIALAGVIVPLAAVPAFAADKVELVVVANNWAQSVLTAMQNAADKFTAAHPNVTVTVTPRGAGWDSVLVAVAAGSPQDVVLTGNGGAGDQMWAPFQDLSALMQRDHFRSGVFEPTWDNFTWQGKVYAVPGVETGPRNGFVWNKEFLDAAGISVDPDHPMNWDTFWNDADKLTVLDADGRVSRMGFDPLNGQNSRVWNVAPMFGATWYDPATGAPTLDNEKLVDGIQMFDDHVFKKYTGFKGSTGWYDFALKHNVAVTNLGDYAPGEIGSRDPKLQFVVSWPPQNEGKRVQVDVGWGMAIPKGAKHPDLSWELIKFLATDVDFQLALYHGSGFIGAGKAFLAALAGELVTKKDAPLLWYVNSMNQADVLDALSGAPVNNYGVAAFTTAFKDVYAGRKSAKEALTEANQQTIAKMQDDGWLPK
ncbi:MAG TPA: extracellular solute-binding protein [Limnochordia bacterium]|nr:extracellular solute-binding protein [Limnochordia bacterium]